jgi:hypothetical protein
MQEIANPGADLVLSNLNSFVVVFLKLSGNGRELRASRDSLDQESKEIFLPFNCRFHEKSQRIL